MTGDETYSVEEIERWWASSTQRGIKRPYTSDTVLSLRDVFASPDKNTNQVDNDPALKLKELFSKLRQEAVRVGYEIDESSLELIKNAGYETAYVQDTNRGQITFDQILPKKVARFHETCPEIALISNGNTDYGTHTAQMQLTAESVKNGIAGFHIDDTLPGVAKHGHERENGRIDCVLVPVAEWIRGVVAARLQLDIMGSEAVLIARTDASSATHITSTIDPRDRPFILGATQHLPRDFHTLHYESLSEQDEWKRKAQLLTLDDAFKAQASDSVEVYDKFIRETKGLNTSEALRIARLLKSDFYWSSESARTRRGWYLYKGGEEAAINRALAVAPIADALWSCSHTYEKSLDFDKLENFANQVLDQCPEKWLIHNFVTRPREEEPSDSLADIPAQLAKTGYVHLIAPLTILPSIEPPSDKGSNENTNEEKDKLLDYVDELVQSQYESGYGKHADGTSTEWWWGVIARVADTAADSITARP